MKRAKYLCIEGIEGVGKGTQMKLLKKELESRGLSVLMTKEPGTERVPLTLELREISLNGKNASLVKGFAREFIFQSIRAIHLNHDVYPNLENFDYIIQDRGIASGLAYGMAFGMDKDTLINLTNIAVLEKGKEVGISSCFELYDNIIFFQTQQAASFLENAKQAKQEFEGGDGIEAEGSEFMEKVMNNFAHIFPLFKKVSYINVEANDGKLRPIDDILQDVLKSIC